MSQQVEKVDEPDSQRAAMDAIYRRQRHFYDATRRFFLFGRDHLIGDLAPPPGAHVLEIACGTARNLIVAARRYPSATFHGFDISDEMLKSARANVARAGLAQRITLAQGDAGAFNSQSLFGRAQFDCVLVSYALSMIPPWREALGLGIAALAPGGRLHIVDFGQQQGWPRSFTRAHFAWLARFSVEPRRDLETALTDAAAAAGAHLRFDRLYRGYADYAVVTHPKTGQTRSFRPELSDPMSPGRR